MKNITYFPRTHVGKAKVMGVIGAILSFTLTNFVYISVASEVNLTLIIILILLFTLIGGALSYMVYLRRYRQSFSQEEIQATQRANYLALILLCLSCIGQYSYFLIFEPNNLPSLRLVVNNSVIMYFASRLVGYWILLGVYKYRKS